MIGYLISLLIALATFYTARINRVGAVRASAIIGILSFNILHVFGQDQFQLLAFGATFVGMSSMVFFNSWHVISASILFCFFFEHLVPRLQGMGGALGFSAFLSISIVFLVSRRVSFKIR